MPELGNYRFQPRQIAQLGCQKAALDYLGADLSFPWLYGGTGYAFVVNIDDRVDPAGPTCWNWQATFPLARNLGYVVDGFSVEKEAAGEEFPRRQQEAWDFIRTAIDAGQPIYGWEVQPWIPDHGVIYGYQGEEYLYSAWGEGRAPWRKLGACDVAVLQVYRVTRCAPAPAMQALREAVVFALRHAQAPADLVFPGFHAGPAAFARWAHALEEGTALHDGHSYNLTCWHECRAMAVAFLGEIAPDLPPASATACADAVRHYVAVRDALAAALTLHPFRHEEGDWCSLLQSAESAALLRTAADAEACALAALGRMAEALA